MTFVIPTAVHLMQVDWDADARARGAFAGTGEGQPSTRNTKVNGSLPLTGARATGFQNGQASSATGPLRGVYWEFLASGGYNVSTDTKLVVWNWQFNAPNRVQCTTAANNGIVFRLGTGTGSPPTSYRTWKIAGNDKVGGQARENPKMIVVDMNVTDQDATVGTYDNTDVQCFGFGTVRFNISGTSSIQYFHPRVFVLDTVKNATNIPRFTGAGGSWDDCITAVGTDYSTKITDEWLKREGTVFSIACPIEFGDNSTATTFDDGGAFVFWPATADPEDPRVHVTNQAFRVYANLRNNAADTLTLSGFYDCGNSYPPWDFDLSSLCSIAIEGSTFIRTGTFLVGSSVSGAATFSGCGTIEITDASANLDGSTFSNPYASHLLKLVP